MLFFHLLIVLKYKEILHELKIEIVRVFLVSILESRSLYALQSHKHTHKYTVKRIQSMMYSHVNYPFVNINALFLAVCLHFVLANKSFETFSIFLSLYFVFHRFL